MNSLPELDLAAGTIAIADLHLDVSEASAVEPFARWLDALAGVSRLVILGDLFDVWVGRAQARMPAAPRVLDALRACTLRGIAIDLVPGNRDFLLERSFEEHTGVVLHAEGFVGLAHGARILFVHGDTLCTQDLGYQRLRRVLRSRSLTWLAPRVPFVIATRVARRLRRASVKAVAAKLPDEKSIQRDAVAAAARAAHADVLVCGHAHEFRDEQLAGVRWIVLDAYGGPRDCLVLEPVLRAESSASSRHR